MEQSQQATRKLVAFAAVVVLCAGAPHFLLDRRSLPHQESRSQQDSPETFLPAIIGDFHVVSRNRNILPRQEIEHVAIYQDRTGTQTAQFDVRVNSSAHNGLACYLMRGMTVQWKRTEEVQSADSIGSFEISSIADQSITGSGRSALFMASTECTPEHCSESPLKVENRPELVWSGSDSEAHGTPRSREVVPLSITFQSVGEGGNVQDQKQALSQFRKLISSFKLAPLRELSSKN